MRTYSDPDRSHCLKLEWVIRDTFFEQLPGWTCYCILSGRDLDDKEPVDDRTLFALEDCDNCDGHGIMPIPPWELE